MGIYIPNKRLPHDCEDCEFCIINRHDRGDDSFCCLVFRETHSWDKRAEFCPLVEVKQHGRLIDADAISEDDRQVYGFYNSYDLQQLLDNAPTIIEAEGKE